MDHDPIAALRNQLVHFDFRHLDVFSFGEQQQCLVGSIDLLSVTRGIKCEPCISAASSRVLEALETVLGKMHQDAALPESLEVFCYSQHLRDLIRTRVQQLVSECIELLLSSTWQELVPLQNSESVWADLGSVLRTPERISAATGKRGGVLRRDFQQQIARVIYASGNQPYPPCQR